MRVEQLSIACDHRANLTFWRRRHSCVGTLATAVLFVLGWAGLASADTINLQWDFSQDSRVAGYVVSVGTVSRSYDLNIDVGATDRFSFTDAQPGRTYFFAVRAYYPGQNMSQYSAEVSARAAGAPTLVNPGSQSTTVGQTVSLQVEARDPEGQSLVFEASGLPPGLVLTRSLGRIDGVPTTAGNYNVSITVSDGSNVARQTFAWTIRGAANVAPRLINPGAQSSELNQFVALQLQTAGSSGPFVFAASGLPPGLNVSSSSGLITGTPRAVGTFAVVVSVNDGALSSSLSFSWSIVDVASPDKGEIPPDTAGRGAPPPVVEPEPEPEPEPTPPPAVPPLPVPPVEEAPSSPRPDEGQTPDGRVPPPADEPRAPSAPPAPAGDGTPSTPQPPSAPTPEVPSPPPPPPTPAASDEPEEVPETASVATQTVPEGRIASKRPLSTSERTGAVAVRLSERRTTQDLPVSKRREVAERAAEKKSGVNPAVLSKVVPATRALLRKSTGGTSVTETTSTASEMKSVFENSTGQVEPIRAASSNAAPTVAIATPVASIVVQTGTPVILTAVAADVEDGALSAAIVWTSSLQGRVGTGSSTHATLAPGVHRVSATVTDAQGVTSMASVLVFVRN